jgi:hypothetical protein
LAHWANAELHSVLAHHKGDLSRVEVHLSNESASKAGGDTRCTMEARLLHHQPIAVSHHAPTQDAAFRGAGDKLKHALDNTLGRLRGPAIMRRWREMGWWRNRRGRSDGWYHGGILLRIS